MYVIREEDRGVATYRWIDVTEYEDFGDGNRREWSPMLCLILLDKDRIQYPFTNQFFAHPIFLRWLKCKILSGILPACFYFLMRCILIGLFIVIDTDVGIIHENSNSNTTNDTNSDSNNDICTGFSNIALSQLTRYVACIVIISLSVCFMGMDIFETLLNYRPRHTCLMRTIKKKFKDYLVQYEFFRLAHFSTTAFICLRAVATISGYNDLRSDFISYTRIYIRSFLWWSILFFIQLLPGADFFVIAIQGMLGLLGQFCLLYSLFLIGYTQLFMITININSKKGCAALFSDLPTSVYSTFLAMINMLDFTQFDIINPVSLYFVHFIYVLFVGILLLNFLVAIMSDRITDISKYRNIILPLQKLAIVLTIENQLRLFGRWYYSWTQKKVFHVYNGRLCIVCEVFNHNKECAAVVEC